MAEPQRGARLSIRAHLDGWSRTALVVIGLVLVLVSGLLQYLTASSAFLVYYLVPVALVAWFAGRWAGVLTAGASALVSSGAWRLAAGSRRVPEAFGELPQVVVTLQFLFFLVVLAYVLTTLRAALERAEQLARTDHLTGVANARYFFELASAEIARAQRYQHPLTIAYIDVDDFKRVNDRFGHAAGDDLLRAVAETIQGRSRRSDVVARLGGDEFALLMPEADYEAAQAAIRKIHAALGEVVQNRGWPVTFSVGVVSCLSPPDTGFDDLIRVADALMYSVKRSGKNMIRHEILGKTPASEAPSEEEPFA